MVIPDALLRAMVALSLVWRWPAFAALVLLGHSAMLHPTEFLTASRRDLVLPCDAMHATGDAYLYIEAPKTRRFARRQHGRVSDPDVVAFLQATFGHLPYSAQLSQYTPASFRSRWNAVLHRMGVPHTEASNGPTPGVLRGSGTTHFYTQTEDIPRICWRGRWARLSTVERYLQEVSAKFLLNRLPSEVRQRIAVFRNAADALLYTFITAASYPASVVLHGSEYTVGTVGVTGDIDGLDLTATYL